MSMIFDELDDYVDLQLLTQTEDWQLWQGSRAEDRAPILLKTPVSKDGDAALLARYHREYNLLRSLDCGGVAQTLAMHVGHSRPVLILEGGERMRTLRELGKLPFEAAIGIGVRLAGALERLHAAGVLHLGLSRDSVLVGPEGEISLVGFDRSTRLVEDARSAADVLRQPRTGLVTMAPEQSGRMNRVVDLRADLYALGVVLYELVAGHPPLEADDVIGWVHAHIATPPRPLGAEVPQALTAVIYKLLEKAAEDRYPSARGVVTDLAEVLERVRRGDESRFEPAREGVSSRFRLSARLYGRSAEAAALSASFERAAAGGRELFLVAGWSGIGKSSLVFETHRPLVERRGHFAMGKFDAFSRSPYSAIRQALRGLLEELAVEQSAASLGERLRARLSAYLPILAETFPELEALVGPQPSPSTLLAGDAQQRFAQAFRQLLAQICSPAHPLVLFIDDLQWADRASLELLADLTSAAELSGLLLVGAYRDNELPPGHRLLGLVDDLRERGERVTTLKVEALRLPELTAFLADSFGVTAEEATSFAGLLLEKTGGNPFFARRFLWSLAREGLLAFDPAAGRWTWDLPGIEARGPNEDVVALMVQELRRLPEAAARTVRCAACIGDRFDLHTLAFLLEDKPSAVLDALLPAVQAGLCGLVHGWEWLELGAEGSALVDHHAGDVVLRFGHDRVRQAAASLIEPERLPVLHLRLARALAGAGHERLFERVEHYRQALEHIIDPAERVEVASSMLDAADRAHSANAPRAALTFCRSALCLLGERPWLEHPELTLRAHQRLAESHHLIGDFEAVATTCETALANCQDRLARARLHTLVMELSINQGRFAEALQAMIEGLELFGVTLGPDNVAEVAANTPAAIAAARAGRDAAQILALPEATGVETVALLEHLGRSCDTAFMTGRDWIVAVTGLAIQTAFRHGVAVSSSMAFTSYGLLDAEPRTREGLRLRAEYGRIGVRLAERFGADDWLGRASVSNAPHIERPFFEAVEVFDHASRAGWEGSAVTWAAYSEIRTLFMMLVAGLSLSRLRTESGRRYARVVEANRMMSGVCAHAFDAFLDALERPSSHPWCLGGSPELEAALVEELSAFGPWVACKLYGLQQLLAVIWGRWEAAEAAGEAMRTTGHALLGMSHEHLFYVCRALALAGHRERGDADALAQVREIEAMLVECAAVNRDYAPSLELVRSARAELEGDLFALLEATMRASVGARDGRQTYLRAIADERAAMAAEALGRPRLAQAHRDDAIDAWMEWGAVVRARVLSGEKATSEARRTRLGLGDVDSLLKACRVISGELKLDALLRRQLELVLENAGADVGMLVLERDGELSVETASDGRHTTLPKQALISERPTTSLIRATWRSGETIVLDDARLDTRWGFSSLPAEERPRAVLCVAIESKGRRLGVMYLENHHATHVFSSDPHGALQILLSQIATSLENAFLYRDLEIEVEERRRADSELRAERDAIASMLRNAPLLVCRVAADGCITYVNATAEAATGRPGVTLIGQPWTTHFGEGALPSFAAGAEWSGVHRYEARFQGRGGEHTVAWTCIRLAEVDDEVLCFGDDVTERRRAAEQREALEEQLRQTQRLESIGTMASGIAHDFNNLLVPIVAYSELLEDELPEQAQAREFLAEIQRAGQRASELVRQILAIGRRGIREVRELEIADVIAEVVELLRASLPASVEIRREVVPGSPIVADPSQIHQALLNLGVNAGQAMPEGGVLTIRSGAAPLPEAEALRLSAAPGDYLRVQVEDTGQGMTAEILERIFEPFFTTKEVGRGTGLGLWVVRGAVESCGGVLDVSSELGRGTCFTLWLPLHEVETGEAAEVAKVVEADPLVEFELHETMGRVLVVDDEPAVARAVARMLDGQGYEVTMTTDPADALRILETNPSIIDAVVTDCTMPAMSGAQLARALHQLRADLPVVLISGLGVPADPAQLREQGFAAALAKPLTGPDLAEALDEALARAANARG